jgi:flagellar biosynthesis chaperone FliJ
MMSSKYSPLIQLKESEIEKLQSHLVGLHGLIHDQNLKIEHSRDQINQISKPTHGTFQTFADTQDIMIVQKIDQNLKVARLGELEEEKEWILNEIKETNIELEKIKYLHNSEVQKIEAERKRKEDREMNEISTILFNTKSAS